MKNKTRKKINNITAKFMCCILFVFACFISTFFFLPENSVLAVSWNIVPSDLTFLSTGDGSVSNPYKISNANQLATISKNISSYNTKSFQLVRNLNISKYTWVPIGTKSYAYSGTFYGNGCSISGIRIDESLGYVYSGLFGYISGANITNLTMVDEINSYVVARSLTSLTCAGAVAGYAENSTFENILNFNVDVYSLSKISFSYAGGIVGQAYNTIFSKVVNMGNVNSITGNSAYNSYAGGIAGYTYSGQVNYARNDGAINGYYTDTFNTSIGRLSSYGSTPVNPPTDEKLTIKIYAGGIIGYADSNISLSYNTNNVSAGLSAVNLQVPEGNLYKTNLPQYSYAGGIAGYARYAISKVYNLGNITCDANNVISYGTENLNLALYNYMELDNHFFTIGASSVAIEFLYNTNLLDIQDIGNTKLSTTKAYAGGIAGFSSNGISYAYNDGNILGGGIEKNVKLSATFEIFTSTTYIGSPTFSVISGLYYCMNITYSDTLYYGSISGNRELVNIGTYSNNVLLDKNVIINGTCYSLGATPSGSSLTLIENYDSVTQSYLYPSTNYLATDLFMNGNPVTYINYIKFGSNVSRYNNNAKLSFNAYSTYYYRTTKNGFGFFIDERYTSSNSTLPLYSSVSLNQNINHSVKLPSSIQASDLGNEWSKVFDKNSNRPYITNFYW